MPAGGYDLLASITTTNNTTNEISFTGIPSTYTNLVVMMRAYEPNTSFTDLYLRVNGLTTTIYACLAYYVSGSVDTGGSDWSQNKANITTNNSYGGAGDQFLWLELYNYTMTTASTQKTFISRFSAGNSASGRLAIASGNINTTAAVSSLQIGCNNSARYFGSGSTFWLYGIYGI